MFQPDHLSAAIAAAAASIASTGRDAASAVAGLTGRGFPAARSGQGADVWLVGADSGFNAACGVDTAALAAGAKMAAKGLAAGGLVLVCGPVPPGATRAVALPALAAAGRVPGVDAFLAYTPGPDAAGRACVGGLTPACRDLAAGLLAAAGYAPVPVSGPEAAEVAGLAADLGRAVRAALGAEVAAVAARLGVDAREALAAAGAEDLLAPADAGRAAAVLFAWGARRTGVPTRLADLATEVAAALPAALYAAVADALNETGRPVRGSRVLLVGSHPHADALAARLGARGAVAAAAGAGPHDLAAWDALVLLGPDPAVPPAAAVGHARLVVDACGATRGFPPGPGRVVRG